MEPGKIYRYSDGFDGWVRSPVQAKIFLFKCVQKRLGAHPVSYPICTRDNFPRVKATETWNLTTHLHLVQRTRMVDVFMSWHLIKHWDKFIFMLPNSHFQSTVATKIATLQTLELPCVCNLLRVKRTLKDGSDSQYANTRAERKLDASHGHRLKGRGEGPRT
jgi:hypothetical protein